MIMNETQILMEFNTKNSTFEYGEDIWVMLELLPINNSTGLHVKIHTSDNNKIKILKGKEQAYINYRCIIKMKQFMMNFNLKYEIPE